jgi:hypothetical protein
MHMTGQNHGLLRLSAVVGSINHNDAGNSAPGIRA